MPQCALCHKENDLKESHIFPKFVSHWIKKTGLTDGLRRFDNVNKRHQDGIKEKLLCEECEQRFSKSEKLFAENIFKPYLEEDKTEFDYSSWLNYFISSVNWRVMYCELIDCLNGENEILPHNFEMLSHTAVALEKYLLEKSTFPGTITNHLYFFDISLLIPLADFNPVSFLKRSFFGWVVEGEHCLYVYSNLCGILLITILKSLPVDQWVNTQIMEKGRIKSTNQLALSPIPGDIFNLIQECGKERLSENQTMKLLEKIKADEARVINSKFLEEYGKDLDMKDYLNSLSKKQQK